MVNYELNYFTATKNCKMNKLCLLSLITVSLLFFFQVVVWYQVVTHFVGGQILEIQSWH